MPPLRPEDQGDHDARESGAYLSKLIWIGIFVLVLFFASWLCYKVYRGFSGVFEQYEVTK